MLKLLELVALLHINIMFEVSDLLMRFRSPIFRKTDNPYDNKFGALRKYSEFHKAQVSSVGFRELVTDENYVSHHCNDVGC